MNLDRGSTLSMSNLFFVCPINLTRRGTHGLCNLLHGGGQEGGRRAGTENILLVVGLGRAAELSLLEQDTLTAHMRTLRDSLQLQLQDALPKVRTLSQDKRI